MAKIVIDPPAYFDSNKYKIALIHHNDDLVDLDNLEYLPFQLCPIRCKMTKEEKDLKRRLYRKEYMQRPSTRERITKRLADPEVIAKRKEYAAREDVQRKKKENAKRQRQIRRIIQERSPELYRDVEEAVKRGLLVIAGVDNGSGTTDSSVEPHADTRGDESQESSDLE